MEIEGENENCSEIESIKQEFASNGEDATILITQELDIKEEHATAYALIIEPSLNHQPNKDTQDNTKLLANAVDNIIDKPIKLDIKASIKNLGPPHPDLNLMQQDKRKGGGYYNRRFNKTMYKTASWLCGCEIRNAFFCFVCMLIDWNRSDFAWTKSGVTDLKHFSDKVKKHSVSSSHLHNTIEFAMLGRSNIRTQLDSAYRLSIKEHNERVTKNRYILNRIIDCIKFCGAFELASRDCDGESSIFKGLIKLLSEVDTVLKQHLDGSSAFIDSKTFRNDILDAILQVCRDIIKAEIASTDFLALQADEATDSANKQQVVLVFRYELKGQIYERFWGFFCLDKWTSDALSAVILKQLQVINVHKMPDKFISQSYDGASVINGHSGSVQVKVQNVYRQAHFIHCYAYQLNLIMEKAVSQNKKVKMFFANLEGFPAYFSRLAKHTTINNSFMEISRGWNFHIRTITTVYSCRNKLIEYFDEIIDKEIDNTMIRESVGLKNILNDADFMFWLNIFNKITPHVDNLHIQLQQKKLNPTKVKLCVQQFKVNIETVRDSIDLWKSAKRSKTENTVAAKEVCDIVISCATERFAFSDHLTLPLLLCPEMFNDYRQEFPEVTFRTATGIYSFIDGVKLKKELSVLYTRKDLSMYTSVLPLLQTFGEKSLFEAFSETVKMMKIICTIPMTSVENERSLSTLKKIKTFLRSTIAQERLMALAMCSIEKDLIQNTQDFNARVIEQFVQQNERRNDFIYKSHNN